MKTELPCEDKTMWNIFSKKERNIFGKYEYTNFEEHLPESKESNLVNFQNEVVEMSDTEVRPFEEDAPLLKKAIKKVVLSVTFLMPLFFLTLNAPGDVLSVNKQALLFIGAAVGLLIWLAIIVRQNGMILRLSGFEWGVLAMVGAGLLASSFSSQVYRSFTSSGGFIALASLGVLFFLTTNFFEKEEASKLIWAFLGGSFLAVLLGVLSAWGVPVFGWITLFYGKSLAVNNQFNTVGAFSNLGALAVVSFVLALGQHLYPLTLDAEKNNGAGGFETEKLWLKFLGFGTVLVSGLLLLILGLQTFYIALALGMLAVLFGPGIVQKTSGHKVKMKATHMVVPLIIFVLSLVLIFSGKYFGFNISGIFSKQTLPVEISLSQDISAEIAKEAVSVSPIFGIGPGNFNLAYDQFRPLSVNGSSFWNARFSNSASEFFDFVTESGLLALAAFVFLLFFVFRSLRNWKIVPAFLTMLSLFFLSPFNLVLMFVFWFLIGLLAITARDESNNIKIRMDDASLPSIVSSLAFVLVLVFGLIGGYMLFQKYRGEIYLAQAARISGNTQTDIDNAADLVAKAVGANNSEDLYLSDLANLLLKKINLLINNKNLKIEEARPKFENLTKMVIQIANQMTSNHQNDALNWFNAGIVYENLIGLAGGADNAAITAYGEYARRVKNDPRGYERIGLVYLSRADNNSVFLRNAKSKQQEIKDEKEVRDLIASDYKNAEDNFKKAVELKKDLATSLYNLGTVYDREGRLKEAIKQLEMTKILNLNNSGLAFELGLLYYRDGQKDKALTEMNRAVDIFRDYSNARWYLALMLEEKGQIDKAIEQLQEILKLEVNKNSQVVKDKLAALEGGKREFPPGKITSRKPLEEPARKTQ